MHYPTFIDVYKMSDESETARIWPRRYVQSLDSSGPSLPHKSHITPLSPTLPYIAGRSSTALPPSTLLFLVVFPSFAERGEGRVHPPAGRVWDGRRRRRRRGRDRHGPGGTRRIGGFGRRAGPRTKSVRDEPGDGVVRPILPSQSVPTAQFMRRPWGSSRRWSIPP